MNDNRGNRKPYDIATGAMLLGLALGITGQSAQATLLSYQTAVLGDNPAAYLRLDESSGATAADSSGNAHNGTYVPGTGSGSFLYGQPGADVAADTAVRIVPGNVNTTMTRIDIANSPALVTATGAYEMWVNLDTLGTSDGQPILLANQVTSLALGINGGTGRLEFWRTGNGWDPATSGSVTTGAWHQVVATYTPSGTKLYLDANLVLNTSDTIQVPALSDTLSIGRRVDIGGAIYGIQGLMDEVSFYNTALSQTQITAHYDAMFAPVPEPGTVLLFGLGGLLVYARRRRPDADGRPTAGTESES